jgi:predicted acetyltransferase
MNLLPYEQGYLDGLCGVYSVINATRLIYKGMREEEGMQLFSACMRHVETRKSLGKVSTKGVDEKDIWSILRKVVLLKYAIRVERPFAKIENQSTKAYLNVLHDYFNQGKRRAAIICLFCDDWDHWTVIRSISPKRIILFDSSMMKAININRCTINKASKRKPYVIYIRDTFFLYQD